MRGDSRRKALEKADKAIAEQAEMTIKRVKAFDAKCWSDLDHEEVIQLKEIIATLTKIRDRRQV